MRLLCIILPHFALRCEALRRPGLNCSQSVITYAEGSQRLLLDYSPELQGLERGMPLQQAISLNGEINVLHADMPHYWSVFNRILDALELKSPLVEGAELGDIYLGLSGLESIYRSDEILAGAVREAVPGVFDARLGIAEGKFLARLAALYSPPGSYKVLSGEVALFLKDLPCDLLPVSSKSKAKLHCFGLHTLGRITALSSAHLQAQFGPEGQIIWELASGQDDTPLYPRLSEETIEESTTLSSPTVSLDLLLMTLEAMLARAFVRLSKKGMGIKCIELWTQSWTSGHWEQIVRFKEPAMNTKVALARIRQVIENIPQPGPVEELSVKITGMSRPIRRQKSLMAQVRAHEHLVEEIKQMELRLGTPQVFQLKEVEPWSRIPERRYTLAPLNR